MVVLVDRFFRSTEDIYYPVRRIQEFELGQIKEYRPLDSEYPDVPREWWVIVIALIDENMLKFSYSAFPTRETCEDYMHRVLYEPL
jgi:hypothetical protein